MLPKSVIVCLAASAFATGALMPTGASAVKGGPMPGTWNWPPYAGSGGGMPGQSMCSYVRVEPYRHKPGKGQWVYRFTSVIRSRSRVRPRGFAPTARARARLSVSPPTSSSLLKRF